MCFKAKSDPFTPIEFLLNISYQAVISVLSMICQMLLSKVAFIQSETKFNFTTFPRLKFLPTDDKWVADRKTKDVHSQ